MTLVKDENRIVMDVHNEEKQIPLVVNGTLVTHRHINGAPSPFAADSVAALSPDEKRKNAWRL